MGQRRTHVHEADGPAITPISLNHLWARLQQAAGVPHMQLHDLRHLHVSLLVRRGLDPRTIADRIGHTDASFTMRRDAHMFDEHRKAAAVNLSDLLGAQGEAHWPLASNGLPLGWAYGTGHHNVPT